MDARQRAATGSTGRWSSDLSAALVAYQGGHRKGNGQLVFGAIAIIMLIGSVYFA